MDRTRFDAAVRSYWTVRESQAAKQVSAGKADAGTRGSVTGGAHLDALGEVIADIFLSAGLGLESIRRSESIQLPGFYRPMKRWDLVVVEQGSLVAAGRTLAREAGAYWTRYAAELAQDHDAQP